MGGVNGTYLPVSWQHYLYFEELLVSWTTVHSVFVGRGAGLWKKFSFCLSLIKHLVDVVESADPRFSWHHHAIWNASCSQDAHTQVSTRGSLGLLSQVACLALLWQHPKAHICQDVRRLRGSQCIHFISLTQAVWDYYLVVYKWSSILTATIAFSRRLQLQQGIQL